MIEKPSVLYVVHKLFATCATCLRARARMCVCMRDDKWTAFIVENREDTRENVGLTSPDNVHVLLGMRMIDVLKFRNAARLRVISGRVVAAAGGTFPCHRSIIFLYSC